MPQRLYLEKYMQKHLAIWKSSKGILVFICFNLKMSPFVLNFIKNFEDIKTRCLYPKNCCQAIDVTHV